MNDDLDQIAAKLATLERTREGDISILSRALIHVIHETKQIKERLHAIEVVEQTK